MARSSAIERELARPRGLSQKFQNVLPRGNGCGDESWCPRGAAGGTAASSDHFADDAVARFLVENALEGNGEAGESTIVYHGSEGTEGKDSSSSRKNYFPALLDKAALVAAHLFASGDFESESERVRDLGLFVLGHAISYRFRDREHAGAAGESGAKILPDSVLEGLPAITAADRQYDERLRERLLGIYRGVFQGWVASLEGFRRKNRMDEGLQCTGKVTWSSRGGEDLTKAETKKVERLRSKEQRGTLKDHIQKVLGVIIDALKTETNEEAASSSKSSSSKSTITTSSLLNPFVGGDQMHHHGVSITLADLNLRITKFLAENLRGEPEVLRLLSTSLSTLASVFGDTHTGAEVWLLDTLEDADNSSTQIMEAVQRNGSSSNEMLR